LPFAGSDFFPTRTNARTQADRLHQRWHKTSPSSRIKESSRLSQTYPSKPIRILTSAVGGSSDFASRQIAQGITESLGQPVIVDNRGNISGELASKAPPDGYIHLSC
jgi:hypothetical protein